MLHHLTSAAETCSWYPKSVVSVWLSDSPPYYHSALSTAYITQHKTLSIYRPTSASCARRTLRDLPALSSSNCTFCQLCSPLILGKTRNPLKRSPRDCFIRMRTVLDDVIACRTGGGMHKRSTHAKFGQEIPLLCVVRPKRIEPSGLHVGESVAVPVTRRKAEDNRQQQEVDS